MSEENLKFCNFSSMVDPSFWHKLCQIKLDKDKLDETKRRIIGSYLNTVFMSMNVDYTSFNELNDGEIDAKTWFSGSDFTSNLLNIEGNLFNFNTIQSFKDLNKSELIKSEGEAIMEAIRNGEGIKNPSKLNFFTLITFSDLKGYNFYYWFCFPAISALNFTILGNFIPLQEAFNKNQIKFFLENIKISSSVFCARLNDDNLECLPFENIIECTDPAENEKTYLCFIDPSMQDFTPGWPLRNILASISYHRKCKLPLNIMCLRIGKMFRTSFIVKVDLNGDLSDPKWVGWERNNNGKFGPRNVNLKNNIDPVTLADSSVDLNLKLMKWRLVKDLNLEIIKKQKCLLLGAGTLGCSVARCLMGWGVRHITFVDNGTVSFSNPVRQSLFTYEDCDLGDGPKQKATSAAQSLKRILPTINSSGFVLDIPMPGHVTESLKDVENIHKLIEEHDVVFLLTDSRESRWLPTVICSSLNKPAFTVALGFDSYLVLRHGIEIEGKKLGCYFCNDVTAPGDSRTDRTLDQQCTVTRPGVSYIASALGVEIFISSLQNEKDIGTDKEGLLGIVPHSVRGFLWNFNQITPSTPAFEQCIACSSKIKHEYLNNKNEFLSNVFKSSSYLETLMGLDELQKQSELADILELSDDEE